MNVQQYVFSQTKKGAKPVDVYSVFYVVIFVILYCKYL